MSTTKPLRKNTNQKVNHGMNIINESKEHLGKVNCNLILIE